MLPIPKQLGFVSIRRSCRYFQNEKAHTPLWLGYGVWAFKILIRPPILGWIMLWRGTDVFSI